MSDRDIFKEIARSVRVDYPISHLCFILGALCLGCFSLTRFVPVYIAIAAGIVGVLSGLAAIGLPVWAALCQPALLRSERYSLTTRAFDVMLDKQAHQDARSMAGQIVESTLLADVSAPRVPRPRTEGQGAPKVEGGDERVDD